jgi:hypothetical protein
MANHIEFIVEKYQKEKHRGIIDGWSLQHKYVTVPEAFLSTNGVMIRDGQGYIAACWLYSTDSCLCFLENFISDSQAEKQRRNAAIDVLIESACVVARGLGFTQVLAIPRFQKLRKRAAENGFENIQQGLSLVRKELH